MLKSRRTVLTFIGVTLIPALSAQTTPAPANPPAEVTAADVSGKWHFVFQTDGGVREFDAEFKVDGKDVTGTWNKKTAVKGTYSNGKLELEFPENSDEVGEGTLKITGRLAEDLTGSWSFQSYEGTFKATRLKS